MSIAELLSDHKAKQASDADDALYAIVRRLANSDTAAVDPGEVIAICDAADVSEDELQSLIDDYEERQRLTSVAADVTRHQEARDKAHVEVTKADAEIEAAEKALVALRDDRVVTRSSWSKANRQHTVSLQAAGTLKQSRYTKFDNAGEAADRESVARNDAISREQSQAVSEARQQVDDAEYALGSCGSRLEVQRHSLDAHNQHPNEATAEIREVTERIERLESDRKEKTKHLADARSALHRLEK